MLSINLARVIFIMEMFTLKFFTLLFLLYSLLPHREIFSSNTPLWRQITPDGNPVNHYLNSESVNRGGGGESC
jgi:hypothetical protein